MEFCSMPAAKKKALFETLAKPHLEPLGYFVKGHAFFKINMEQEWLKYIHLDITAQGHGARICYGALPFAAGIQPGEIKYYTSPCMDVTGARIIETGGAPLLVMDELNQAALEKAVSRFICDILPSLEAAVSQRDVFEYRRQEHQKAPGRKARRDTVLESARLQDYETTAAYLNAIAGDLKAVLDQRSAQIAELSGKPEVSPKFLEDLKETVQTCDELLLWQDALKEGRYNRIQRYTQRQVDLSISSIMRYFPRWAKTTGRPET